MPPEHPHGYWFGSGSVGRFRVVLVIESAVGGRLFSSAFICVARRLRGIRSHNRGVHSTFAPKTQCQLDGAQALQRAVARCGRIVD